MAAAAFGERPRLEQLAHWTGGKKSRLDDLLANRVQRYEPIEMARLITCFSRAGSKGALCSGSLAFTTECKSAKRQPNTVQLILAYEPKAEGEGRQAVRPVPLSILISANSRPDKIAPK